MTNYVRAMEYGLEQLKTLPVSLRLIRELHGVLMEGVRGDRATPGEFRRSQNWIGRPGCTLNRRGCSPPVPEMHEALDAFEKYLHAANIFPPWCAWPSSTTSLKPSIPSLTATAASADSWSHSYW